MSTGAPPWTLWQQPVITVNNAPVPEDSGKETVILETEGKVTDTSQTYQTLASWTVTALKSGKLKMLELAASDYTLALFQVTVGGVVKQTDLELPQAWNGFYADTKLEAGTVVLLEGKSSDGTSVDLWGIIEGTEVA